MQSAISVTLNVNVNVTVNVQVSLFIALSFGNSFFSTAKMLFDHRKLSYNGRPRCEKSV